MDNELIDYLSEVLLPIGRVRSKRMFGGVGIYINDLFCAIIIDGSLYFKGDEVNEADFFAAKCPPFTYDKDGSVVAMRYYKMPDEAMDDAIEMCRWAKLGLGAALRKAARPKRISKPKPKPKAQI